MAHKRSPSTRKLMTICWILWFSTWQQTKQKKKCGTYGIKKRRSRQSHGHWKLAIHKKTSIIIHHIFAIPIVFSRSDRRRILCSIQVQFVLQQNMLSNYLGLCQMYVRLCKRWHVLYYELNNSKLGVNWWRYIWRWFILQQISTIKCPIQMI